MKKVIKCGNLFSVEKKAFEKNKNVYINDNIIESVETGEIKPGYEIIDLSDKYVLPGLIDAHLHTNFSGNPGDLSQIGKVSVPDYTLISLKNAQQDLLAGFTTIRDEGSISNTDIAVRDAIKSGIIWGPRIFASGSTITATGGHGDSHFASYVDCNEQLGIVCNSPDKCREAVRHLLKYGADQIKLMSTGGVTSEGDDVGAPEFTFEELKAICDEAKGKGKITSAHAHGGNGIKLAVRAGITSIEHGTLADQEAHDMMLEMGTYLVPTLSAGYNICKYGPENGLPKFMIEKSNSVVDSHFKTFKRAYDMGIKIAFGTDCGTPFTVHGKQATEFELMVNAGCKAEDAIIMATKNAASLLKLYDKIGSIEKGKLADIIAVDSDPIKDITQLQNVTFVMKDSHIF